MNLTELFESEVVEPYVVDKKAYVVYKEALDLLSKTQFRYTADDPDVNYELHCVHITWEAEQTEIRCGILVKLLSYFDVLSFDNIHNMWTLSKEIYRPMSS